MWPEARGCRDRFRLCVERDWRLACPVDAPFLRGTVAFGGHAPGTGAEQTGGQRIVDLHISPLESYIQIWCTEDLNITLIFS